MSLEVVAWPIEDVEHLDLMLNHMRLMTHDASPRVEAEAWREIDRLLDKRNAAIAKSGELALRQTMGGTDA